jgi:hypothetical protein
MRSFLAIRNPEMIFTHSAIRSGSGARFSPDAKTGRIFL